MKVTKQQIIDGVFKYADSEVIPHLDVKMVKQIAGAAMIALKLDPSIADKFLKNSIVSAALKEKDGLYDLDFAENVLCETIRTYGKIEFVPPIPRFLLGGAENKTLIFGENDIKTLKSIIEKGECSNE